MPDVAAVPLPLSAVAGASPLYVTGEDTLRLTAFNSAAGVTVTLTGRFVPVPQRDDEPPLRPGAFRVDLVPTTNRVATVRLLPLSEGWLLDYAITISAGTPSHGQCFVKLQIVRGTAGATQLLSTIAQGYVTTSYDVGGIGVGLSGFTDGAGALRSITGTTPAPGVNINETVPTNARWDFLALSAQFQTAIAVANRIPYLSFDDGVNVFAYMADLQTQAASAIVFYQFGQGLNAQQAGVTNLNIAPTVLGVRLGAGYRIRTVVGLLQAADQWSAVQYLVREWIEGN
jgi:hypothetical protein